MLDFSAIACRGGTAGSGSRQRQYRWCIRPGAGRSRTGLGGAGRRNRHDESLRVDSDPGGFQFAAGGHQSRYRHGRYLHDWPELRAWLRSPGLALWSAQPNWPTTETRRAIWLEFIQEFALADNRTWARRDCLGNVQWLAAPALAGTPVSLFHRNGQPLVLAPDGHAIGLLQHPLNPSRRGLVRANVAQNVAQLDPSYLGPYDLWTS